MHPDAGKDGGVGDVSRTERCGLWWLVTETEDRRKTGAKRASLQVFKMRFRETWPEFIWETRLVEEEARFASGASDTVTCYRKYYPSEGKAGEREHAKHIMDMDESSLHGLILQL